jgi:uncharacterized membrane protein
MTKAEIGGTEKEWNAEITEQIPDQRIAWTSVAGAWTGGTVTFHQLSDQTSKVLLRIDYEPQGFVENVGDAAGLVTRRVEGDLERSKSILNGAGKKRGTIQGTLTTHSHVLTQGGYMCPRGLVPTVC